MTKIEYKKQRGPMCIFQGRRDKKKITINGDKPPNVVIVHRTEERES
jgi:hypothetical protein